MSIKNKPKRICIQINVSEAPQCLAFYWFDSENTNMEEMLFDDWPTINIISSLEAQIKKA